MTYILFSLTSLLRANAKAIFGRTLNNHAKLKCSALKLKSANKADTDDSELDKQAVFFPSCVSVMIRGATVGNEPIVENLEHVDADGLMGVVAF